MPVSRRLGPPTYFLWDKCYSLLRTCLISFRAVPLGTIEAYRKQMSTYHDRYGKQCWHILYQADVRMRQEHMERIRRKLRDAHTEALAAGGTTPFDPARPWAHTWAKAAEDHAFWKKEIEDPCMLYLTKTASLGNLLGDDAPIDAPGASETAGAAGGSAAEPGLGVGGGRATSASGGSGNDAPKKANKVHNVANGEYQTNRKGMRLCPDFQEGSCTPGPKCPKGAHQCKRCLSAVHGAVLCHKDPPPAEKTFGAGKGKGKTKKGGPKGSGRGYAR